MSADLPHHGAEIAAGLAELRTALNRTSTDGLRADSRLRVLQRATDERYGRNDDAGADAGGVAREALKLRSAEPAGDDLRRRQPYGSRNGFHSSSSRTFTGGSRTPVQHG